MLPLEGFGPEPPVGRGFCCCGLPLGVLGWGMVNDSCLVTYLIILAKLLPQPDVGLGLAVATLVAFLALWLALLVHGVTANNASALPAALRVSAATWHVTTLLVLVSYLSGAFSLRKDVIACVSCEKSLA